MAFKLSEKIGEKYRIQTEKGGFLRQMGPRKLSKDRAEYRIAVLNGEEPYDYPNDETSPETSAANQATVDNYVAEQEGKIATAQGKIDAANDTIREQQGIINSYPSVEELDATIAAQQAIIDDPEASEEAKAAAETAKAEAEAAKTAIAAAQKKINTANSTITTQTKNIATYQSNIENAADKAPATSITEVPETLVLDNTPKKGYKIEADFTANEVTTIEANEKVEGGISIKNTGDEPANLIIDVGNSDVTLATNSEWDTVTVKSVADDTLTVATYTHIKKLVVEKGRVWVNNALVEDCIDEVVVEGGKVEANPVINATKVSDLGGKPSVVKINSNLSTTNYTVGVLTSGHYIYENNARVDFTRTGSTSAGFLLRGSKLLAEFKGPGEWHSANNPCIWLSDFDGVIKIHDGKFFNDANSLECIYAEKGFIEIYGGEFHNVKVEGEKDFLLNCKDANYQAGKAGIKVYGGKFYGFDPAANAAESSEMTTNFVAEGYESIFNEEGGYYEVKPING